MLLVGALIAAWLSLTVLVIATACMAARGDRALLEPVERTEQAEREISAGRLGPAAQRPARPLTAPVPR